jgi:nucleoside-diphosphate-sugar epimerase
MPKILVTGCKGFIGSQTISYLQEKGYNVIGINEDIRIIEALRPYFKDAEFVIHTAGKVNGKIQSQDDYFAINVEGTENVIKLCVEYGCKLIHLSSIATEGLYGISKQKSQKIVEEYCLKHGLKAIILRLCVIYNQENNTRRPGARYPIERLVEDIENIINSHDYSKFKLIDYSNIRV